MIRMPGEPGAVTAAPVVHGVYRVASLQRERGGAVDVVGVSRAAQAVKEADRPLFRARIAFADQDVAVGKLHLEALSAAQGGRRENVAQDRLRVPGRGPQRRMARLECELRAHLSFPRKFLSEMPAAIWLSAKRMRPAVRSKPECFSRVTSSM